MLDQVAGSSGVGSSGGSSGGGSSGGELRCWIKWQGVEVLDQVAGS